LNSYFLLAEESGCLLGRWSVWSSVDFLLERLSFKVRGLLG
jgi:hypothetical protein